jgi:hypothetical protein
MVWCYNLAKIRNMKLNPPLYLPSLPLLLLPLNLLCGSVGGSHSWLPVERAINWWKMPL